MSNRQHSGVQSLAVEVWPPDDTEVSVVGTDLHQEAITNVRLGLNESAQSLALPGQPPPWHAFSQTRLIGLRRRDGSAYSVMPDVFVYRQPIDRRKGTIRLRDEGPPVLIVEVASDRTYRSDLDVERGKGFSYAAAGVAEYLVLDPTGAFVPEQGRGWQLVGDTYQPWKRDAEGRWVSELLPVALAVEGAQVAVYDQQGRRQLREGEINATLARQAQEIVAMRRRLEELQRRQGTHNGEAT